MISNCFLQNNIHDELHHIIQVFFLLYFLNYQLLNFLCYYKDNSYFTNVIYRYSLKRAIEDRRVKMVEYIADGNIPTRNEDKWKAILKSHDDIKSKLNILPLTLVVTADVPACKRIADDFKKFLQEKYNTLVTFQPNEK